MRISRFLVLLALALPGGIAADDLQLVEPEQAGMSGERLARISDTAKDYVDQGKVPGVITMVNRGGKLVHFETVGTRGVKDPRPLAADDLFRIYSMTKPITAVAAMQLYERGGFRLTDPVSDFVPELGGLQVMEADGSLVPVKREATMHDLLAHTAGFSYGFEDDDPVDDLYREAHLWGAKDLTDFAERLGTLPLRYQPGERWYYSVAVDVTGVVVERISGKSFDEYLHDEIFEPLGMDDTFFQVPPDKLHRFLPNHRWDAEKEQVIDVEDMTPIPGIDSSDDAMTNYEKVTLYSGGGGLVSTAMDYMKFAEMLRAGGEFNGVRIIGPKTLKYMVKNHLPATTASPGSGDLPSDRIFNGRGIGFGLGFGVIEDPVAIAALSSKGAYFWGGAAGTVFWVDPVEDIVGLGMIQLMSSPWTLREDLRTGIYQALDRTYE